MTSDQALINILKKQHGAVEKRAKTSKYYKGKRDAYEWVIALLESFATGSDKTKKMEYKKLQDWEKIEVFNEVTKMYPNKTAKTLNNALEKTNPAVWYDPDNEEWCLWDASRPRFEAAISGKV